MSPPLHVAWLCCVLLCGCADTPAGVAVVAATETGRVEGLATNGVARFLGIPYAQPPVGALRWQPPERSQPWDDVRSALNFGPWCPQPDFDRLDEGRLIAGKGVTVFVDVPPAPSAAEDCLTLNVWTPADTPSNTHANATPHDSARPVMLFIHGNALGSSYPLFDGTSFAANGVVFVSVNFRMYTMGHFAHPALTRESAAGQPLARFSELDIIAALQWLQRNVAAFGGDPANVTLLGQSNGGAAILKLLTNRHAEGLFHRAIVQSGNGWWEPLELKQHEQLGCMLASAAGLPGCDATAAQLRSLDWRDLPATGPYSLDGRTWRSGATELMASGQVIDVPVVIGWNDYDGSSLRYPAAQVIEATPPSVMATYQPAGPDNDDLAYAIYTDKHAGAPARWVAHQLQSGAPSYLFVFSHVPWVFRGNIRGAEHGMEFPYAFNTWDAELPPLIGELFVDQDDTTMTTILHQCWLSFAKTGVPECPHAPAWPRYNRAADQLLELKVHPEVRTGYRAQQLDAHENVMQTYLDRSKRNVEEFLRAGLALERL